MTDFEEKLEKLVVGLFEINAVKFGDFTMKVGIKSPVYMDLRVIVSHPKLMDLLSVLMTDLLKKSGVDSFEHICGVPYTALPIATLISVQSQISMLIRRKETKEYGTRKLIEGQFNKGDRCVIIEDVVTSGSSVLDTVKDLEQNGLKVNDAVIVLDREQGAVNNLKEKGIRTHVLVTLSRVMEILLKAGKVTDKIVKDVDIYIKSSQVRTDGTIVRDHLNGTVVDRLKIPFSERAKLTNNSISSRLFALMEEKKTLLCVAADVNNSEQLLQLAHQVGPHVCIFKTHFDAVKDFDDVVKQKLLRIAKDNNFLILEDRKFGDIGNTVSLQFSQIYSWADLVTVHSLTGPGVVDGLKSALPEGVSRGCFLVAEMSCQNNLITKEYVKATMEMAKNHPDIVVGLVCQSSSTIPSPSLIQLTPGVKIDDSTDALGQSYNSPEHVVLQRGADVAVVGRGIILADDPSKQAQVYKERLWNAYLERIK